jgi:hypothetical protein
MRKRGPQLSADEARAAAEQREATFWAELRERRAATIAKTERLRALRLGNQPTEPATAHPDPLP